MQFGVRLMPPSPTTLGFLVETAERQPARFATLAEARALVRFLNDRGLDCALSVCSDDGEFGEVVYPLSHHSASPRPVPRMKASPELV